MVTESQTSKADTMAPENSADQQHGAADPDRSPEASDLAQQLQAAQARADENRDKLLRLQAEMDNLRKRTTRDIENAHKYALERFVNELLPVIDSLELGINAASNAGTDSDDSDSLREGMELTLKMLQDAVGKFGVEPVDPQGEKFDPQVHEAVTMQDSQEAASGTVLTVVQKGYLLNDRLVRPAMVVVAK